MASLHSIIPGGFNSTAVEPQQARSGDLLPAGTYTVEITNAEVKELKSGNGTGLALEFTVIDPEQFARRKVWQNLNLVHTNEQAQQIGQAQLSALCRAVGIEVLEDSDQLFQSVLKIRTKVTPAKGDYPARADVADYMAAGAPMPAAPAPARAAAPAPNAYAAAKGGAGPAAAPWARKSA